VNGFYAEWSHWALKKLHCSIKGSQSSLHLRAKFCASNSSFTGDTDTPRTLKMPGLSSQMNPAELKADGLYLAPAAIKPQWEKMF
jgi:hypothetical protein